MLTILTNLNVKDVHQNLKLFKCKDCDSCFSQNSGLKVHVNAVYLNLKSHKCEICKKIQLNCHTNPFCRRKSVFCQNMFYISFMYKNLHAFLYMEFRKCSELPE